MTPVALVTGASSGIGRATAEEFARQGYSVIALARRREPLETLVDSLQKLRPEGRFLAIPCDISDWAQVTRLAKRIEEEFPYLNVLVNNAGSFEYKSLEKSSPEKIDEMVNVNVRGLIYMCKAFLPHLKKAVAAKKRAKIVNVSSIGGLWGFSNMAVYTATKFGVTGFSSALRRELQGEGIDVGSIHPGPVRNRDAAAGERAEKRQLVMLPHQIAGQIYSLAASNKAQRISHPAFSVLNLIEYFSPKLVDKVLKKIL